MVTVAARQSATIRSVISLSSAPILRYYDNGGEHIEITWAITVSAVDRTLYPLKNKTRRSNALLVFSFLTYTYVSFTHKYHNGQITPTRLIPHHMFVSHTHYLFNRKKRWPLRVQLAITTSYSMNEDTCPTNYILIPQLNSIDQMRNIWMIDWWFSTPFVDRKSKGEQQCMAGISLT